MAQWIQDRYQVSCRRACALGDICPNTWYYRSQARDASALRMRIRELAQARRRFGYTRIWILLRREGWRDNKKRVHRLYRLEGLQVRMRVRRKKRLSLHRGTVPPASGRKPVENAFIESFNGRLRDECLNVHTFESLAHAQQLIEAWRRDYNDHRPHGALGHQTPSEYAEQGQQCGLEGTDLQLTPV